ncbi:MAG: 2-oxoacid:ferredoxin oxidoreductase subunit gamma [Clostridiales bacterium]|nr:2-oxoacid:ferredoxin oxidoreductase subunit gamma [Clostridiales bacterium]
MDEQLIIAGFGGQGVQLMGQLLAKSGMKEGKNVSFLPSYGPEMRGGTTNCNVVIADDPIASPIVGEATCAMVLNLPSLIKFEDSVIPGGALIVNSSLCTQEVKRNDIKVISIPANDVALELGNIRVVNMIMLGAYLELTHSVKVETVLECLKENFGPKKQHLVAINEKAIAAGASYVK